MATERRGTANAGSGSGTSAVPNVTGVAGIASGDLMLAMAMVGTDKTASIGITDAGAAWTVEANVYNGTTDESMFFASKAYNAGDDNPTISWTGSSVWGASVLVGYSDIAAALALVIAGPLDDYSFGDGNLPFPEVANTAVDDLIAACMFGYNNATVPTGPAGYSLWMGGGSIGANRVPGGWYINDAGSVPCTPSDANFASGITAGSMYSVAWVESVPAVVGDAPTPVPPIFHGRGAA